MKYSTLACPECAWRRGLTGRVGADDILSSDAVLYFNVQAD